MNPKHLEQRCDEIHEALRDIVDDNESMFCALENIYRLCLEADEDNWAKTVDEIKMIAWRLI